jgi:hypothetical protein
VQVITAATAASAHGSGSLAPYRYGVNRRLTSKDEASPIAQRERQDGSRGESATVNQTTPGKPDVS